MRCGASRYWDFDQEMCQRVLAARSFMDVRMGIVLAAFLKILPVFMLVYPGIIARVMFEKYAPL